MHLISLSHQGRSFKYWVIERFSLQETLQYLKTFCEFYVYSHGLRDYVLAILRVIDPHQKYFRDYDHTVIAPLDPAEQQAFNEKKKCFKHFTKN